MNPRVAAAFSLYLDCREVHYVHIPLTKDRGKKTEHKIIGLVGGWSTLPEPGGLLDQPNWLMTMFDTFRHAENAGSRENLS